MANRPDPPAAQDLMFRNTSRSSVAIGGALLRAFGIDPDTVNALTLTASVDTAPTLTVVHVAPDFDEQKFTESIAEYTLHADRVEP